MAEFLCLNYHWPVLSMAREILLLLLLMEAAAMAALLCDSSVCFGLYRDEYVNLSLIGSALFFSNIYLWINNLLAFTFYLFE